MTTEVMEEQVPDTPNDTLEGEIGEPTEVGTEPENQSFDAFGGEVEAMTLEDPVGEDIASPVAQESEPLAVDMMSADPPVPSSFDAPAEEPALVKEWKVESEEKMVQKSKEEAERKRELIQNGQQELEQMMREAKEQNTKRREAAMEESQKREREAAGFVCEPGIERTKEESWSLVCDLIDFKKDTKCDLTKFKSLLIQLKHA